jgi:hypothetical protein
MLLQAQETLFAYLQHPDMIKEVSKHAKCESAIFTGMIFEPTPYSPGTPHGMPPEFEAYHNNPQFTISYVPPVVMFKSKIFKPSRLCAIYEVQGACLDESSHPTSACASVYLEQGWRHPLITLCSVSRPGAGGV